MKKLTVNGKSRPESSGSPAWTLAEPAFGVTRAASSGKSLRAHAAGDGAALWVFLEGRSYRVETARPAKTAQDASHATDGEILSPMPGRVFRVSVQQGESVKKGREIVVVEAMKMEHVLSAPCDGTVERLEAVEGRLVESGQLLALIVPKP